MANSGYLHFKKNINKKLITQALTELNTLYFKNELTIEYVKQEKLFWVDHPKLQSPRLLWITQSKEIKVRHGCGSQYAWWIDTLIRHFIAYKLDGTITDDGFSENIKGEPDKYKTFKDYMVNHYGEEKGMYFYNIEKKDFGLEGD